MAENILQVNNLTTRFRTERGVVTAVQGVSFHVQRGEILGLVIGNIIVLLVGVILNYFILDLDYSRIEKVQFEDDDYYYYVTAVPKIRIAEEEKEVKKI